ncbi:hypothetical protein HQ563_03335 [bacterium]|nr:hypothetical protein [bacterium]
MVEASQQPEVFRDMFLKAADDLNRRYARGTDEYVREHNPELRKRLNEVWIAGRQGKAGLEDFRDVLKRWYFLHLRAGEIQAAIKGQKR